MLTSFAKVLQNSSAEMAKLILFGTLTITSLITAIDLPMWLRGLCIIVGLTGMLRQLFALKAKSENQQ